MGQDQHDNARSSHRRRDRFEMYYYERVGERYYLRVTRFSLYLMIGLAVAFIPLYLLMESSRDDNLNLEIMPRDESRDPTPPKFEPLPLRTFSTPARRGTGAGPPARRRSPSPSLTPAETPAEPPDLGPPPRPTPAVRRGANAGNSNAAPRPSPTGNTNE